MLPNNVSTKYLKTSDHTFFPFTTSVTDTCEANLLANILAIFDRIRNGANI
jgi:hypothetical protein